MSKITFFTKTGGGEKSNSLNDYIYHVNKSLETNLKNVSIEPIIQMHIEIRIDGDILIYDDPAGCSHLKFLKKKNVIAITIAVTKKQLVSLDKAKFFLKANILIALSQMTDRLIKEKFIVNKSDFINNVELGLNEVL